jgi:hypothetical protein
VQFLAYVLIGGALFGVAFHFANHRSWLHDVLWGMGTAVLVWGFRNVTDKLARR